MNKIVTKLAVLAVAALSVLGLSACGGSASAEPTNLNGTYVFVDGDFGMVGEVKGDTIQVQLKSNDSLGLYWTGDFKNPAKDGDKILSHANVEALSKSATGSQDSTKEFEIADGKIAFQMSMMGVSKTIELEKNSSSTN